jgi:hypothetical protein
MSYVKDMNGLKVEKLDLRSGQLREIFGEILAFSLTCKIVFHKKG